MFVSEDRYYQAERILRYHASLYPGMLVRDAVKLLFQSVTGAGHFISDNGSVSKALIAEMPEQQNRERFLGKEHLAQNSFVPLGGGYVRADLFVAYSGRMSVGRLADLFSASVSEEGDKESLKCLLEILPGMASEGIFAFGKKEASDFIREYVLSGMPVISHSADYRRLYLPSYRIVRSELLRSEEKTGWEQLI